MRDDDDGGEPEDPVVARPVDEHPAEREADAASRSPAIARASRCRRDLLARELVADDPEGQREDAAAEALEAAADDQRGSESRARANQRADANSASDVSEQALLAEHVAQAAEDRGRDRGDEQVGGDDPGDAALGGAELALQVGSAGATSDCSSE